MGLRLGVLALSVWVAACGGPRQRVVLQAPRRDAPVSDRFAAYERLRPVAYERLPAAERRADIRPPRADERSDWRYLSLAGGVDVEDPRDLLPLVPPRSRTAIAARAFADRMAAARNVVTFGIPVTLAVGTAVIVALSALAPDRPYASNPRESREPAITAAAVLSLGLGLLVVGLALHQAGAAREQRAIAFETFDAALRERLQLCARGLGLAGCEEPPSAAPPGVPSRP